MDCYNLYTLRRYIDINEVRNNPELPWDKMYLSLNDSITIHDVDNLSLPNSTGNWRWRHLSKNIDIKDIRQYSYLPWNKIGLSENLGITANDLEI